MSTSAISSTSSASLQEELLTLELQQAATQEKQQELAQIEAQMTQPVVGTTSDSTGQSTASFAQSLDNMVQHH